MPCFAKAHKGYADGGKVTASPRSPHPAPSAPAVKRRRAEDAAAARRGVVPERTPGVTEEPMPARKVRK